MATIYLSIGSSIQCKPAQGPPRDQKIFEQIFITLLENKPGETITMAPLTEDPRTIDLSRVPPEDSYLFREGETWGFPLGNSGLSVTVMLLGWTQDSLAEAILNVGADARVQFHAHRRTQNP